MARKKKDDVEEGAYWMDTYGDMVTLILTFFVLLFAMSSLDQEKWEVFVKAFASTSDNKGQFVIVDDPSKIENGTGTVGSSGDAGTIGTIEALEDIKQFEDLFMYLEKYIKEQGLESDIELYEGEGFTYIKFTNSIFFDGDKAQLRPEGKEILTTLCGALDQVYDKIGTVDVNGHTAQELKDIPNRISFDWQLSSNRAANVVAFIQENSKIVGAKFTATGHGQHLPMIPHDGSEATRRANRRVELTISKDGVDPPSLEQIYKLINGEEMPKDSTKEITTSGKQSSTNTSEPEDSISSDGISSERSEETSSKMSSE